jgi:hypothetical protein
MAMRDGRNFTYDFIRKNVRFLSASAFDVYRIPGHEDVGDP